MTQNMNTQNQTAAQPNVAHTHTPTPWFAVRNSCYWELNVEPSATAQSIAEFCPSKCAFGEEVEKANVEFAVRACNAYERDQRTIARLREVVVKLLKESDAINNSVMGEARAVLAETKDDRP